MKANVWIEAGLSVKVLRGNLEFDNAVTVSIEIPALDSVIIMLERARKTAHL